MSMPVAGYERIDIFRYRLQEAPVNPTRELVAALQQDRERSIAQDRLARLARLAARARACCPPGLLDRVARALRLAPEAC